MKITHFEITSFLLILLALVNLVAGYWLGHKRAYAECCDCCTCQLCEGDGREDEDYDDSLPRLAVAAEDHRTAVPVDSRRPDQDAGRVRPPVEDPGAASLVPGRAPRALAPAAGDGSRSGGHAGAAPEVRSPWKSGEHVMFDGRPRAEPGRTIYPDLAALSETAADGPEDDAEARTDVLAAVTADRLWLETVLLSWESRYPIHQEA